MRAGQTLSAAGMQCADIAFSAAFLIDCEYYALPGAKLFIQSIVNKGGEDMGRGIDRLALLSLLAGSLYLFFAGAMGSVPLAAASAFFAMALIKKLSERLPTGRHGRGRRGEAAARAEIERLALSEPREAEERILRAVNSAYPGQMENATLAAALRHPSGGKFTAADLCAHWIGNRQAARLVIVSLAAADAGAFALAARLKEPEIRLIDGVQLISLLAACPEENGSAAGSIAPPRRMGRMALVARAACRARVGKCALTGAVMFLVFMATGRTAYLAGTLILLFIAGVGAHGRARPGKLFG